MAADERMNLSPLARRLVRDGLTVAAVLVVCFVWWLVSFHDYQHDAIAYWSAGLDDPYRESLVGRRSTFLYSPAFAQITWPLTWLPWEIFRALWGALNLGALVFLAGPVIAAVLLVIPGSPVIDEVSTGNIHLLLAAAIFLAFRWPHAWAFPLLTKVTPGIAIAYLAGARRWRDLATAVGVTAVVCALSLITVPHLWVEWARVLTASSGVPVSDSIAVVPGPLVLRTAVAGVVALVGGWLGWRWMVPVAALLALPVPWSSGLSVLVAVVGLWRRGWLTEPASQRDSHGSRRTESASA